MIDTAMSGFKSRAQCLCPSLTASDFDLMYDPVTAALNVFNPRTTYPSTCAGQFGINATTLGDFLDITNLPNTCTLSSWTATGKCSAMYPLDGFGLSIGFTAKKCASSRLPAVTVNCIGAACDTFLKPCNSDSDCSGGTLQLKNLF